MHPPTASETDRDPAPLSARLLAAVPATAAACAVAPVPTLVLIVVQPGPSILLAYYPFMVLLVLFFAGPVALPIMLALAAADMRRMSVHIALGAMTVPPALILFSEGNVRGLLPDELLVVLVVGGMLGGFAAAVVREFIEARRAPGWPAPALPKRGPPG